MVRSLTLKKIAFLPVLLSIAATSPAHAQGTQGGLQTLVTNVGSMFNGTMGAQLVGILFIVAALHDAWHKHFIWLPIVVIASTVVLGVAWYLQTWYGVTVTLG